MAKETTAPGSPEANAPARQEVNVQLVPSAQAEQPILSNFTMVHPASGIALVDFGFLDPGSLAAMSNMAKAGKKVPERFNGRLAARVAMPYDVLANLHRQITAVLQAASKSGRRAPDKPA
jgi:hypothetical protein